MYHQIFRHMILMLACSRIWIFLHCPYKWGRFFIKFFQSGRQQSTKQAIYLLHHSKELWCAFAYVFTFSRIMNLQMSVTKCLWVNISLSFLRRNAIVIKSLKQYCSDGKLEWDMKTPVTLYNAKGPKSFAI